jgi:hypothetical protein
MRITRQRLAMVCLAVALSASTLGADGCAGDSGSQAGSDEFSGKAQFASKQERRAEKRRAARQRAARRRERRRAARRREERQRQREQQRARDQQKAARPAPEPAQSDCDPNYKGACLDPNASDYDCEGGSGDGPEYTGTVTVVGDDHYDLNRDDDNVACDP